LDEDRALVVTTDFFTPVVDDPYDYGAIAASNSLSDVYAMGGEPFLTLNIAALPPDLPTVMVSEILRGGAEKTKEAGAVIVGGHTVQDKEPKFGMVVIGFVHPKKMLLKGGARAGDLIVITKPLGFGMISTAHKQDKLKSDDDLKTVVGWMKTLNKTASQLAMEFNLRGGTDVTGFSLLGHAVEMANAAKIKICFDGKAIPFVDNARHYAENWIFPGGAADNKDFFNPQVKFDAKIDDSLQMMLFDPQTSGGLMLAVPSEKKTAFETRAKELNQPVWFVGEVQKGNGVEVN
jgi:selenide,water dikinase